jgi:outer membrane immunogenic protein
MNQKIEMLSTAIAVSFLGVAPPAQAADFGYPTKAPAAVMVSLPPVFNWDGIYFGGQVGGGWGTFTSTDSSGNSSSASGNGGIVYGGFIGNNWIIPGTTFVLGTEIDGNWTNESVTFTAPSTTTIGKENLNASARVRVGMFWDRWLVYMTGGGAYGYGSAQTCSASSCSVTVNEPGIGWTIGGGVDYALPWYGTFTGVLVKYTDLTGLNTSAGASDKFADTEALWRFGFKF